MKIRSLSRLLLLLPFFCSMALAQEPNLAASSNVLPAENKVEAVAETKEEKKSIDDRINQIFKPISNEIFKYVFAGPKMENADGTQMEYREGKGMTLPLILIWLVGTSLLLTIIFKFVNLRELKLAFNTVRGKYNEKDAPGEITHFQALTAALSGTVGLGNISGVAIAISVGGAGAIFWMVLAGFLGMTAKFCECTLGVHYRKIDKNGRIRGGAMYYLRDGLAEQGMKGVGKVLALLFAIVCVGASFGAGNMYQVQQATSIFNKISATEENLEASKLLSKAEAQKKEFITMVETLNNKEIASAELRGKIKAFSSIYSIQADELRAQLKTVEASVASLAAKVGDKEGQIATLNEEIAMHQKEVNSSQGYFAKNKWAFGLIIALLVGSVIIGGIKSIAKVTAFLIPFMCGIYVIAAIVVLCVFFKEIPAAFGTIFSSAFGMEALSGGMIGAFIQGIRRSSFSNEAGFGSAPIAHAAVKTKHSASEGLVALLEPFVDTIIVCTMTGLVIVVTGMHEPSEFTGIELTSEAFRLGIPAFPSVLAIAAILFAISTMFSWSYYGQQAWAYIFGESRAAEMIFKGIFCFFIVIGSSLSLGAVLDFSDGLFFFMCLFNLIGVWALYPVVRRELKRYKEYAATVDAKK